MYNGMMDPELMRLAQEQMSKIPPSELAKIQQQMMSNPELIRMASAQMQNMRPEDFKSAAEQMKRARVEDMTEISKKIAGASPEELAAMTSQADSQVSYVLSAAQMLKKQGNELHNQGKFSDAAEKYLRAKNNLKDIPVSKGRTLQLACSLNLMSCYLKTKQYDECIKEGSEVLDYDTQNIKALYRRGQAYKELGLLEDAVSDLSRANSVSPDDETIADILRDTKEKLSKEGGEPGAPRRLVIEELDEEGQTMASETHKASSSVEYSVTEPRESDSNTGSSSTDANPVQGMDMNPETLRSFQDFISKSDPDTLAALGGGGMEGMSPDMLKMASNMMKDMPPEELQNMFKMATSLQGKNPTNGVNFRPGSLPENVSPDMLKTASDMMKNMSPEELQKMFEVASNFEGNDSFNVPRTNTRSTISESTSDLGETSSSTSSVTSNLPASMGDMQEQMRNQMNDPAMRQMFTSMIKNMNPDMMANMSEQFGIKMSKEEAAKAQQAMSSMSPETLDKMMRWVDRAQRGVEATRKTKNWLLGRPGMILAIFMLILAIILHRLGYIGS